MEKVIYKTKGTIRKKMGKYFIRNCLYCKNSFETRYTSLYCSKSCVAYTRKNTLGKTWRLSDEQRRNFGSWMVEDKNPNWKGGVTKENEKVRKSLEYKIWRDSVFKRDNYTCVLCNVRSSVGNRTIINADHIKPFSLFPSLRFELSNGRTLCVPCHRKTDTYGVKFIVSGSSLLFVSNSFISSEVSERFKRIFIHFEQI